MAKSNKLDLRQIVLRAAQAFIGSLADDTVDTVIPKVNDELAKLFEDRNVLLSDGGNITYSGTSVSFSDNLKLVLNSKVAGGSPVIISLGSATRNVAANNNMIYAVIDRIGGTAIVTDNASTLPAVTSSNQEVFLIAKRIDDGGGAKRLYFRSGFVMNDGDSTKLGEPAGSDTTHGLTTFNTSAGGKTVSTGTSLFNPYLTISAPDTYTVQTGAELVSVTSIIVNGTLIIQGTGVTRVL